MYIKYAKVVFSKENCKTNLTMGFPNLFDVLLVSVMCHKNREDMLVSLSRRVVIRKYEATTDSPREP